MPKIEPTSSFGRLFVDERHGYIGICPKEKYNPKKCVWYNILDIRDPGLYCIKPRCDGSRVKVDCEIAFNVPSQGISVKTVIKKRIYCNHHPYAKDKNYEEWSEPGSISIMRGILIQTYSNAVNNDLKYWEERLYYINICLEEQARCAFFLPREYTEAELEDRYINTKKIYENYPHILSIIERYYKVLKENIL